MKRCRCGGPCETPDSNGIVRARTRRCGRVREDEAPDHHRRRDHQGEEPVDRKRQPVVEQGAASSRTSGADASTIASAARTEPQARGASALQVSRSSRGRAVRLHCASMATIEQTETDTSSRSPSARPTKVKALMAREPAGEAEVLRVAIQGGGCSGFEYALGFDRGAAGGRPRARVPRRQGRRRPVQRAVPAGRDDRLPRGLQESGFKIENPNVASACGCGRASRSPRAKRPTARRLRLRLRH